VLAAANPKYGRFETTAYPVDQFNIPAPLMSRFDLIFPIRDVMDEEQDKRIAKHILMQHEVAGNSNAGITIAFDELKKPPMDYEILRKYIAYAKRTREA
jgi:Predicted ATPase involved in replication control, Cdc46/Mcm family